MSDAKKKLRKLVGAVSEAAGYFVFAAVVPKYAQNDPTYTPWIVGARATEDFDRLQAAAVNFNGMSAADDLMQWAYENGFVVLTSYLGDGPVLVDVDSAGESDE